jgi:hypothetical protein
MDSFRYLALKQIAKSAGILVDKVKEKIDQTNPIAPTSTNTSSTSNTPNTPNTQPKSTDLPKFNYSNANISLNVNGTNVAWPGPQVIHSDGSVNFLFFFRGGNNSIMSQSQTNAIVINADAGGGGGGPSAAVYGSSNFINTSIQSILKQLEEKTGIKNLHVGKLGLASFSGGYDAVYHILKQKSQINYPLSYMGVFDGMHHGGAGKPDEKAMETWGQEAEEAAKGGTQFVIAHSAIKPGYCSSTDSSNWLVNKLGIQRKPVTEWNGVGRKPESIAQKGNFQVIQLYSDKSQEPNEGKQHMAARDFSVNILPSWN